MTIQLIKPLTWALFIALAFGQLGRLPGLPADVNVYVYDLLIVLILAVSLRRQKLNSAGKAAVWFIGVAALSLLLAFNRYPLNEWFISCAYLIRFAAYFGLYLVYSSPKVKKLSIPLKKYLSNLAVAWGVIGLLQYLVLPDTRFLWFSAWDDHYYRILGSLGDPGYLGLMLLLGLILSRRWWLLIPLLLTYSRSTFLSLLAVSGFFTWMQKSAKWLIAGVLLLAISLPLLPRPGGEGVNLSRVYSIVQRGQSWQEGVNIWRQNPVFGVGFNTLRYYRRNQDTLGSDWQVTHAGAGLDNSFLFILSTTGIVGFLAYLNLLKHLWKRSIIIKLSLIAAMSHALFQNSLFYPLVMIWMWLLLATDSKD
jgi:O-antigen ligase